MPADRPRPPPVDLQDLDDEARRELVAEAFHTFDEETARDLAAQLDVSFESCREAIARLGRLHG